MVYSDSSYMEITPNTIISDREKKVDEWRISEEKDLRM